LVPIEIGDLALRVESDAFLLQRGGYQRAPLSAGHW
jgi:hypothetical protein